MPKISQLTAITNIGNVANDWVFPIADPTTNTYKLTKQQLSDIFGARVVVSSTAPITENQGDLWFDDTTASLYVYVGAPLSAWVQTNGGGQSGGGGATVTVSNTVPADPVQGDLWFHIGNNNLNVYVADTINAWVNTTEDSDGNLYGLDIARAHFSISSGTITISTAPGFATITRLGNGHYRFVLAASMASTNYTVLATRDYHRALEDAISVTNKTTTSFEIFTANDNSAHADPLGMNVAVLN